jgi:hypothetical protein
MTPVGMRSEFYHSNRTTLGPTANAAGPDAGIPRIRRPLVPVADIDGEDIDEAPRGLAPASATGGGWFGPAAVYLPRTTSKNARAAWLSARRVG